MRPRWSDSLLLPLLLVLLPAAGLLTVGVAGMWRALRAADEEARVEAGRSALALARTIRSAAADPRLLDRLDGTWRFELRDGRLEVPQEVAWIGAPPPESPEIELPRAPRRDLEEARRLEFEERDSAGAARVYDRILADPFVAGKERAWVIVAAAWSAHRGGGRGGDAARRDALLERLDASPGPMYRDTVAGSILLRAACGRPLPGEAVARFRILAPERARGVLDRMREIAPHHPAIEALHSALAATVARRGVLRLAGERHALLVSAADPLLQLAGGSVLLFFPARPGLEGAGAVVPPRALAGALREAAPPGASRLVFGAALPADAIPAIPGIGVLPAAPATRPAWTGPWVPVLLVVVLGGTLALGLSLSIRALRRERAAVSARSEFLTSVTHELKTPLASIQLLGDMLQEGRAGDAEHRRRYLRRLAAETGRLRMIVENVLDLGRTERSERSYDMRPIDGAALLRDAVRLFEPLAERDGLEIEVDGPRAGPRVRGDRDALVQVVLNLLENARRHAQAGRRVRVGVLVRHGLWRIRVRDHGPGVPQGERGTIFEKFRRGSAAAANGNPGVGLGLFLARGILRDHGGELRCESPGDGGGGACFTAEVPVLEDEAATGEGTA